MSGGVPDNVVIIALLNGFKITDNQWLNPGDTVSLEIDGLGTLTNNIVLENG